MGGLADQNQFIRICPEWQTETSAALALLPQNCLPSMKWGAVLQDMMSHYALEHAPYFAFEITAKLTK